jgi:hypothetical protein
MKRLLAIAVVVSGLFTLVAVAPSASASGGIWVQQTARALTDTCPDGWGQSWAQWPNGNTGGYVCNRYVNDPSANPDVWVWWANLVVLANATETTPTPRCLRGDDYANDLAPLDIRLDPSPAGVTIQSWATNTTVVNSTGASQTVGLNYLCPQGYELYGVI